MSGFCTSTCATASGKTRSLIFAGVFGALTFYGYNTFQPVIVATALLLGAVDARFHWKHRRTVLAAVALTAVLALPYVRFVRTHSREVGERLRSLDSYWTDPRLTLGEKLGFYGREYARAYDPRYWFRPDPPGDIGRHTMKGYTHVPLLALPFVVAGAALCARRIRSPGERTLLVALLCAPAGAAIVRSGITRAMILVVLFGMLVGVAADPLLGSCARRLRPVVVGAFVGRVSRRRRERCSPTPSCTGRRGTAITASTECSGAPARSSERSPACASATRTPSSWFRPTGPTAWTISWSSSSRAARASSSPTSTGSATRSATSPRRRSPS